MQDGDAGTGRLLRRFCRGTGSDVHRQGRRQGSEPGQDRGVRTGVMSCSAQLLDNLIRPAHDTSCDVRWVAAAASTLRGCGGCLNLDVALGRQQSHHASILIPTTVPDDSIHL
eukprot:scaffold269_cov123-Isochrysis_galbana.AAC.13